MPEYVLNRTYTHRSTLGHIVNFVKGQPVYVPPLLEREVTALGAEPVDGERMALVDGDEDKPLLESAPQGDERRRQLLACFAAMAARNQRGDFTGQGRPNVKAVAQVVGFEVDNRERDEVWEAYMAAKAE